ncbi:uncharacterized protein (DUF1330 family) [Bradyrhizobium sp. IAR9]|nr:DUF1330 domain-containing protein [Bradyrhizobium sp. IAR9]NYG45387.1 uncharacterized protein (DUF1330 family) [Bradyrhizobium sp. IAR9]
MLFEFDSSNRPKAFRDSPDYSQTKTQRLGAVEGDFIFIEGTVQL